MSATISKMIINIDGEDYLITKTGVGMYIMDSLDNDLIKDCLLTPQVLREMIKF